MTKRKIVKCFRDEFAPNGMNPVRDKSLNGMNEFEKWWSKQPDVDCRKCSQNGWLAALKRVFEEYQKSPNFGGWIRKEISDMENKK